MDPMPSSLLPWRLPAATVAASKSMHPLEALVDECDRLEDESLGILVLLWRETPNNNNNAGNETRYALTLQHKQNNQATLEQKFVSLWAMLLYLGMIIIVAVFTIGCRGRGNPIGELQWTEGTMSKEQGVVLVCMYAGLGWTLSNRLILNPIFV